MKDVSREILLAFWKVVRGQPGELYNEVVASAGHNDVQAAGKLPATH